MSDKIKMLGALAALGTVGVLIYFARKVKASDEITPTLPETPSTPELESKILDSQDLTELNSYYNQIGGLLTAGRITTAEYDQFYTAYVQRFYQLTGVSA